MAKTAIGISTSAITWEKTKSQINIDKTGLVEISVEGAVNSNGIGMEDALDLIPDTLPSTASGPIGATSKYSGAALVSKNAFYEEGTWQVSASYEKSGALTIEFPDGTEQSDNDRTERRIVVAEEPLLSHPVVLAMPTEDKNMLANLMRGNIEPNLNYDPDDPENDFEFAALNAATGEYTVEKIFSATDYTAGGVTASPLDYARLIKAGITTYQRKSIRHSVSTTRDNPAPNAEYRKVGTVVDQPPGAPTLADDFQWMLTGIVDSSGNGETWVSSYEYEASGPGGFLGAIYEGGNQVTDP